MGRECGGVGEEAALMQATNNYHTSRSDSDIHLLQVRRNEMAKGALKVRTAESARLREALD